LAAIEKIREPDPQEPSAETEKLPAAVQYTSMLLELWV
jgi:hypothetical protein